MQSLCLKLSRELFLLQAEKTEEKKQLCHHFSSSSFCFSCTCIFKVMRFRYLCIQDPICFQLETQKGVSLVKLNISDCKKNIGGTLWNSCQPPKKKKKL